MCDENTLDFVNELQAYMVRVIELEAEVERLRAEAQAQFDRGYYDGCANPIVRYDALHEALERIEAATRNEVRAGDKGYISRYGINGIARTALEQNK